MNRDIYSQAEQLNKKHRRKRTWYKILSVPICLVVIVTAYALILPAITMESTPDTSCGIAEFMNPEGEASSGETGDDVPADNTPVSDVSTDAAQGGNMPGDAVQSTGAANGDTPEGDAAVNSTPAQALAASDPIDVTGVALTITDNVSDSGCYEAAVTGGDAALEEKTSSISGIRAPTAERPIRPYRRKTLLLTATPCLTSVGSMAKSCSWPWTAELSATRYLP